MQNDVTHAALLWHTAHGRRIAVSSEKRRLEKLLKNRGLSVLSPVYTQQIAAARELTELKRRELALLRNLAKACAKQRGELDTADVVDLGGAVTLLPAPDGTPYMDDSKAGGLFTDRCRQEQYR